MFVQLRTKCPTIEFSKVVIGRDDIVSDFIAPRTFCIEAPQEEIRELLGQQRVQLMIGGHGLGVGSSRAVVVE